MCDYLSKSLILCRIFEFFRPGIRLDTFSDSAVSADRGWEGECFVFLFSDQFAERCGGFFCSLPKRQMDLVTDHVPAKVREDVMCAAERADVDQRGRVLICFLSEKILYPFFNQIFFFL